MADWEKIARNNAAGYDLLFSQRSELMDRLARLCHVAGEAAIVDIIDADNIRFEVEQSRALIERIEQTYPSRTDADVPSTSPAGSSGCLNPAPAALDPEDQALVERVAADVDKAEWSDEAEAAVVASEHDRLAYNRFLVRAALRALAFPRKSAWESDRPLHRKARPMTDSTGDTRELVERLRAGFLNGKPISLQELLMDEAASALESARKDSAEWERLFREHSAQLASERLANLALGKEVETLRADARRIALDAIENERLVAPQDCDEDRAYDQAVTDCYKAVAAALSQQAKPSDEATVTE